MDKVKEINSSKDYSCHDGISNNFFGWDENVIFPVLTLTYWSTISMTLFFSPLFIAVVFYKTTCWGFKVIYLSQLPFYCFKQWIGKKLLVTEVKNNTIWATNIVLPNMGFLILVEYATIIVLCSI